MLNLKVNKMKKLKFSYVFLGLFGCYLVFQLARSCSRVKYPTVKA